MAWVIGVIDNTEKAELERRGWRVDRLTAEQQKVLLGPMVSRHVHMVYVDNDLFKIMSGPDWEKGEA